MNVYSTEKLFLFKLTFLLLVSCFCCNACIEADEMKARLYIEDFKMVAIEEMHRMGVPASIKLAQAMLESDYGYSRLAQEGKNHFGIKCKKGWQGQTIYHTDDAPDECFRKYRTVYDSYLDHSNFLRFHRLNYYEHLFDFDKTDYKSWAYGLKKAGYATNPRYAELLINLIERYDLYQYDTAIISVMGEDNKPVIIYGADSNTFALANTQKYNRNTSTFYNPVPTPKQKPLVTFKDNRPPIETEDENASALETSEIQEASEVPSPIIEEENTLIAEEETIETKQENLTPIYKQLTVNGKYAITSNVPLMPAFVAHTYSVPLSKLYNYNDLLVGQKFKPDTPIFFQKKKNKAETKMEHVVREGETMHDIAQLYGIKLMKLYRRNKMPLNGVPITGEIVQLQKRVKESPKYRL